MKQKLADYRAWRAKAMRNPETKKAYEEAESDAFVDVALQIIKLREINHITQYQLAKKIHSSQQAIARLESLKYKGYKLGTLEKIAGAFHKRLIVQFV